MRVPALGIECNNVYADGRSHIEPCQLTESDLHAGFTFFLALENRLFVTSVVDDEGSTAWLTPSWSEGGSFLGEPGHIQRNPECLGFACESCWHWGPINGLLHNATWRTYESRTEFMKLLADWSRWTYEP